MSEDSASRVVIVDIPPKVPRVMIATPTEECSVAAPYMISLLRTIMPGGCSNAQFAIAPNLGDDDISRVRSYYIHDFLQSECDYLLMIDADHDWPPEVIRTMVDCAVKEGDHYVAVRYRRKSIARIDYVVGGVGLTLLSRELCQKMTDHYREELWFTDAQRGEVVGLFLVALSDEEKDKDGRRSRNMWSEDYAFRERALALGYGYRDLKPAAGVVGHWGVFRFGTAPEAKGEAAGIAFVPEGTKAPVNA